MISNYIITVDGKQMKCISGSSEEELIRLVKYNYKLENDREPNEIIIEKVDKFD